MTYLPSFTVTGTDINGNALNEVITGPSAGGNVISTNIFRTVTQISSNAAAASVDVGTKSVFADLAGKDLNYKRRQ